MGRHSAHQALLQDISFVAKHKTTYVDQDDDEPSLSVDWARQFRSVLEDIKQVPEVCTDSQEKAEEPDGAKVEQRRSLLAELQEKQEDRHQAEQAKIQAQNSWYGWVFGAPETKAIEPRSCYNPLLKTDTLKNVQARIQQMRETRDINKLNNLGAPKRRHMLHPSAKAREAKKAKVFHRVEDVLAELLTNNMFVTRMDTERRSRLQKEVERLEAENTWYNWFFGGRSDDDSWET
jgi:hypothetical protein